MGGDGVLQFEGNVGEWVPPFEMDGGLIIAGLDGPWWECW